MSVQTEITRRELAEFLQLTPRRIDQLIEERVLKSNDGVLDFSESIRALLSHQRERATPAIEKLNAAKASREERKDRQESGEDISASIAIRATEGIRVITVQRIMRIGNNVQSRCGLTEEQRRAVDEESRSALTELSKKIDLAKEISEIKSDEDAIKSLQPNAENQQGEK